jgi:nitrile hydratase accessory protein
VSGLDGIDVPRRNGELAFDEPWQSRVFGMAVAVVETRFGKDWEPFRSQLIAAIAADEERPYWESWTAALEELLVSAGLVSADELAAVTAPQP